VAGFYAVSSAFASLLGARVSAVGVGARQAAGPVQFDPLEGSPRVADFFVHRGIAIQRLVARAYGSS